MIYENRPALTGLSAAWQSLPATVLALSSALILIWTLPVGFFQHGHAALFAVGGIGLLRNLWLLTNQLRSFYYRHSAFSRLRKQERALAQPYPQRLYVIVPSYREDPLVTQRAVAALAKEVSLLPCQVFLLFSVASVQEMAQIRGLVRQYGRRDHLKFNFMVQSEGKRMALGQALRLVSREYLRVSEWHVDAPNDIVVLMDGDTEVRPGTFRKSLGFFKLLPDLGALTTNEAGHMLTNEAAEGAINPWFNLKFAKRHTMMSSHALSGRVMTLTGRFSVFRAGAILHSKFIERIETDHIDHWIFGRFRFLMGDDKSTWFDLLAGGWRMLYLPDVCVNCLETRGGNFFSLSKDLMFRWFGNMARNNWRALSLGPQRMPFFIWLTVLDQRVSMWTSLIGPLGALFGSWMFGSGYLALYLAWVLTTRTIFLWLLVPNGFVIRPIHIGLQIYDQWVGSALKISAMLLMNRQSWSKANNTKVSDHGVQVSARDILAWHRLWSYVAYFVFSILLLTGVLIFPGQFHLF